VVAAAFSFFPARDFGERKRRLLNGYRQGVPNKMIIMIF
jgi:hypothetical protein